MVAQSSRPPTLYPPSPVIIPTLPSLPLLSPTGSMACARLWTRTHIQTYKPSVCVL